MPTNKDTYFSPKGKQLRKLFVENPGKVFRYQELYDTLETESMLAIRMYVHVVRKWLASKEDSGYVRNVSKRGYIFVQGSDNSLDELLKEIREVKE